MQTIRQWFISVLAVVGAFFLGGISGELLAEMLGLWPVPIAGFTAAFCVVCAAFGSAPRHNLSVATVLLLLGASIAWTLLEPSHYPEDYANAYLPTHIPILLTLAGGILGWIMAALIALAWPTLSSVVPRDMNEGNDVL